MINNNNNNNNNKFLIIWKNLYLRKIIIKYLKLYNIFYYSRKFKSINSILEYKYKEYLCDIKITNYTEKDDQLIESLPKNIESIYFFYTKIKEIPTWLRSIEIRGDVFRHSIFKSSINLQQLNLDSYGTLIPQIPKNVLPNTLTSLKLCFYEHKLKRDVLPNGLLKLYLGSPLISFQKFSIPQSVTEITNEYSDTLPLEKEYLPSNLKYLNLFQNYTLMPNGVRQVKNNSKRTHHHHHHHHHRASPLSTINGDLNFNNNNNNSNNNNNNSNNVLYDNDQLSFYKCNDLDMDGSSPKKSSILLSSLSKNNSVYFPENLEFLRIDLVYLSIKLPSSLKELHLKCTTCDKYTIPNNLEKLDLQVGKLSSNFNKFIPKKLKYLSLKYSKNIVEKNGTLEGIFPKTLEYLELACSFNQKLTSNIFGPNLTSLIFSDGDFPLPTSNFNNGGLPLVDGDLFSQSLTHLDLGPAFNQPIGKNVLSKCRNLKKLILGKSFNFEIIQDSIPFNLNELIILNLNYSFNIKLNNPMTIVQSINYFKQFNQFPNLLKCLKLPININNIINGINLINNNNINNNNNNNNNSNNSNTTTTITTTTTTTFNTTSFSTITTITNTSIFLFDKINLEYLDISHTPIKEFKLYDLPIDNKIKTLILSYEFETLNLELFKNLENLVVSGQNTKLYTSVSIENNEKIFNFYNLKSIKVSNKNTNFLDSLEEIWYQFIYLI